MVDDKTTDPSAVHVPPKELSDSNSSDDLKKKDSLPHQPAPTT
eukprot:CAMPEP_0176020632 /NCGR_PEP_ID=MMETSP0120_2-20121206/9999_1 /TAXON_ID=160619 /ORGANISM="Kryptoperidinium foliaceum, Strain CCMP 1326" /LENGTH=42 /DNA_ID= /DNA_START= /DNA_END= /DNA_ORIENTATION=